MSNDSPVSSSLPDPDDLYDVGRVIKPFGRHGEVSVECFSGDPERFAHVERVFAQAPRQKAHQVLELESARPHKGMALVGFVGIESIDDAETLRGFMLRLPREELMPLDEGEYFLFDLLDCAVFNRDGDPLGTITAFDDNGPQLLLELTDPQGRSAEIPFVDAFFPEVDVKAKRMTLTPIQGLLPGEPRDEA